MVRLVGYDWGDSSSKCHVDMKPAKMLGKVLERVVAGQFQALLDETDFLDPFQSGFRPGFGTETAVVALYDDFCRERDRGSVTLLILLDLSVALTMVSFWVGWLGWELEAPLYSGFAPSWLTMSRGWCWGTVPQGSILSHHAV